MSRALIASATEDERDVQARCITNCTLDNAARTSFPKDADDMTAREEFLLELPPFLLDGSRLKGAPHLIAYGCGVRCTQEGHNLWESSVCKSPGLDELNDVGNPSECIAGRLRLSAHCVSLPSPGHEIVRQG